MTPELNITINGIQADYESVQTLPLSLSKKTDKFMDFIGSDGTRVDNPSGRIVFPATKRNQLIFKSQSLTDYSISIKLMGSSVLDGKAIFKDTIRQNGQLKAYSLELIGGTLDAFSQLDGLNLCALELGETQWTEEIVRATWTETYDDGHLVSWLPKLYGQPSGTAAMEFKTPDMRPDVYYPTIIKGIENHLGYTIESTFFETGYFKRHAYLYGVGKDWQRGPSSSEQYFRAETIVDQTIEIGTVGEDQLVKFPSETDTGSIWSVDTFTVPQDGQYKIDVFINKGEDVDQGEIVYLQISNGYQQFIEGNSITTTGYISLLEGDTVQVYYNIGDSEQDFTIYKGSWISGKLISEVSVGDYIDIASCLHCKPVKDFLRGITHQFNLAWSFDPVIRRIYVEPRFDYTLPDGNTYPGFYHSLTRTGDEAPIDYSPKIDIADTKESFEHPFGSYLMIGNKPSDTDIYKSAKGSGGSEVDYLGVKYNMGISGISGKSVPNPFFHDLVLASSTVSGAGYMPICLPDDHKQGDELPEPTYKLEPTYAYVAGTVEGFRSWRFEGSLTDARPLLFQKSPPGLRTYDDSIEVSASYCDSFESFPNAIKGYVSIFYEQYLAIVHRGDVLEAKTNLSYSEFGKEDFRRIRKIRKAGNWHYYILLEIGKFDVISSEPSTCKYIHYHQTRREDSRNAIHNQQVGYIDI